MEVNGCEKVFPFFQLPPKIRNIVYQFLFKAQHSRLNPRPLSNYIGQDRSILRSGISRSLSFLRSCQQAYEEASVALYGSNIFNFDTTPLDPFSTEYRLCDQCQICRGPIRVPDQNRKTSLDTLSVLRDFENVSSTSSMSHYTHSVFIPRCGIAYMYQWLKDVGEDNRHRLRHLTLSFMDPNFALFANDTSRWEYRRRLGGDLVCKGLDLLSQGHQLQTLEI